MNESNGSLSADRVADVLFAFISTPASVGVSHIARETGLSKTVVHRIFQSLLSRGFLKQDPISKGYSLGPSATALGSRSLRDTDMRRAAHPVIEGLRDVTNETTTVSEIVGDWRIYLEQIESRQTIRMLVEVGRPHALHAGGSGKAILAFLPAERREQIIANGLARLTDVTITDAEALRAQLREIAQRGFAVSLGERAPDAGSVAAPIFANDGEVIGSLSICGPVGRFTPAAVEEHSTHALQAGADVSRRMGWTGSYPPRIADDGSGR